jgi:N utilization substance protein A
MSVVIDNELLQTIAIVEKITHAHVDRCIPKEEKLVFVVGKGDARKIVGPQGATLKKLESQLGKRLKIIEKVDEKQQFIRNAFLPLKIVEIKESDDGIVTLVGPDEKTKGLMIGAKAHNLRFLEKIVQQYFPDVKEIKVV